MNIQKTVFTVTVLHEKGAPIGHMDLEDVLSEIDTGDMLGACGTPMTVDVPPEAVEDECRAVGNDGTFFATDDEEETEDGTD